MPSWSSAVPGSVGPALTELGANTLSLTQKQILISIGETVRKIVSEALELTVI